MGAGGRESQRRRACACVYYRIICLAYRVHICSIYIYIIFEHVSVWICQTYIYIYCHGIPHRYHVNLPLLYICM